MERKINPKILNRQLPVDIIFFYFFKSLLLIYKKKHLFAKENKNQKYKTVWESVAPFWLADVPIDGYAVFWIDR
jgi:hypothetical protein